MDYESGAIVRTIPLTTIENPQTIHALNRFASPIPFLEGGVLFAHFGAFGTFAIDVAKGKVVWNVKIDLEHGVGPGSSLIVHRGLLVLICDGVDRRRRNLAPRPR